MRRVTSIRTRVLGAVVLLNLVGAVIIVVFLHQSLSGGLDVWAEDSLDVSVAAWNQPGAAVGTTDLEELTSPAVAMARLEALKAITESDYGLMMDKGSVDQAAYEAALEATSQPSNWNERDNYVLIASTNDALSEKMQLKMTLAEDVPEIGKMVGIQNGSCTALCHRTMKQEGDFWKVSWSENSNSSAHVVFPVTDSAGKQVGVVYSIEDVTPQAQSAKSVIYSTMAAIVATLLIVAVVIGGMLDVLVFRRLNRMIVQMEELSLRVAGGDFDAQYTPSGENDEIGQFEAFFGRFLELVTATLRSFVGK